MSCALHRSKMLWMIGIVAMCWPAFASAQSGKAIAVITLDETTSADALVSSVKNSLQRKDYEVFTEAELRERLRARQASDNAEVLRERFVGITEQLKDGVNAYFYDGHKVAIQKLSPHVGLGLQNLNYVSANPALAQPVYEGAATLLRAYFDARDAENAKALASVLARSFPSQLPSASSTSPEVIQLILTARQALEAKRTDLEIKAVDLAKGCKIYLNGLEVSPGRHVADADTTYYLSTDCGDAQEKTIWMFKPEAGVSNRIPVIARDPLSYKIKDATFESRDQIEQVLRFISRWSGITTIVGVSKKAATSTGDGVLMVRVEEGKSAVWSDGADQVALERVLPRILPELTGESLNFGAPQPGAVQDGGSSVWGWASVGLGVAAMGAGGYLFYAADAEAQKLRCSNPNAASTPSGCGDVERYDGLTTAEFDDRSGAVSSQRILAGGALGLGAILTGVGVWLLLDDDDGEAVKASTTLFITPGPDGFGAGIRAEF